MNTPVTTSQVWWAAACIPFAKPGLVGCWAPSEGGPLRSARAAAQGEPFFYDQQRVHRAPTAPLVWLWLHHGGLRTLGAWCCGVSDGCLNGWLLVVVMWLLVLYEYCEAACAVHLTM